MTEKNLSDKTEPEDIPFITSEQYVRDVFAGGGCIFPVQLAVAVPVHGMQHLKPLVTGDLAPR